MTVLFCDSYKGQELPEVNPNQPFHTFTLQQEVQIFEGKDEQEIPNVTGECALSSFFLGQSWSRHVLPDFTFFLFLFGVMQIPSLKGKVAIVTGGNGGIGLETVRGLATNGAKVYMASRTESKARSAIDELNKEKPVDIHYLNLDLKNLNSAKDCAKDFLSKEDRLDILVCNAGVMAVDYELTPDGFDQTFQVNHLTHFLLFKQLANVMEKTGKESGHPARLVNLSSFAVSLSSKGQPFFFLISSFLADGNPCFVLQHNFITWNPFLSPDFSSKEAINRKMGISDIGKYMRYSQAKLSALLFSRELNKRYPNGEIRSTAVHPGFVASNLYQGTPLAKIGKHIFIKTSDGALSSLYGATSEEIEKDNSW